MLSHVPPWLALALALLGLAAMFLLPHDLRFYGPPDRLYPRRRPRGGPPPDTDWHEDRTLWPGQLPQRPPVRGQVTREGRSKVIGHDRHRAGTLVRPEPAMPPRPYLSPEYRAYKEGRIPGLDGVYWPDRTRAWLAEHRRGPAAGRCEWAFEGVCQGRAFQFDVLPATYRAGRFRRELRSDVVACCRDCHVYAERARDAGYQPRPLRYA